LELEIESKWSKGLRLLRIGGKGSWMMDQGDCFPETTAKSKPVIWKICHCPWSIMAMQIWKRGKLWRNMIHRLTSKTSPLVFLIIKVEAYTLANLKVQAFRPTTQFHEEKGVMYGVIASPGMYLYGKSHSQATLGSNLAIDYMHKKYQSKDDDTTHAPLPRTAVLPTPPSQPTANAPPPSSHSLAPGPGPSPLATFPITSIASSNIAPPTTTPTVTQFWNALTAR